jgi:hypothetical protein
MSRLSSVSWRKSDSKAKASRELKFNYPAVHPAKGSAITVAQIVGKLLIDITQEPGFSAGLSGRH